MIYGVICISDNRDNENPSAPIPYIMMWMLCGD